MKDAEAELRKQFRLVADGQNLMRLTVMVRADTVCTSKKSTPHLMSRAFVLYVYSGIRADIL